jgi:hypothetical protein
MPGTVNFESVSTLWDLIKDDENWSLEGEVEAHVGGFFLQTLESS